jgi:hypothetical protein
MSYEQVTHGEDFVVEFVDRASSGRRYTALQVHGKDGSLTMGALTVDKSGNVSIAGTPVSGGAITANTTIAAGLSLLYAAGSGGLDAHLATGAFKIGAASATLGFFGATAVSQPSAYTQTYNTALKTVAVATSHTITDSSGGTASTTAIAALTNTAGAADVVPVQNAVATLAAELALVKADLVAAKKVINALIDDLVSLGLVA